MFFYMVILLGLLPFVSLQAIELQTQCSHATRIAAGVYKLCKWMKKYSNNNTIEVIPAPIPYLDATIECPSGYQLARLPNWKFNYTFTVLSYNYSCPINNNSVWKLNVDNSNSIGFLNFNGDFVLQNTNSSSALSHFLCETFLIYELLYTRNTLLQCQNMTIIKTSNLSHGPSTIRPSSTSNRKTTYENDDHVIQKIKWSSWYTSSCVVVKRRVRSDNVREEVLFKVNNLNLCDYLDNKTVSTIMMAQKVKEVNEIAEIKNSTDEILENLKIEAAASQQIYVTMFAYIAFGSIIMMYTAAFLVDATKARNIIYKWGRARKTPAVINYEMKLFQNQNTINTFENFQRANRELNKKIEKYIQKM